MEKVKKVFDIHLRCCLSQAAMTTVGTTLAKTTVVTAVSTNFGKLKT
jgi:hypothetical protein